MVQSAAASSTDLPVIDGPEDSGSVIHSPIIDGPADEEAFFDTTTEQEPAPPQRSLTPDRVEELQYLAECFNRLLHGDEDPELFELEDFYRFYLRVRAHQQEQRSSIQRQNSSSTTSSMAVDHAHSSSVSSRSDRSRRDNDEAFRQNPLAEIQELFALGAQFDSQHLDVDHGRIQRRSSMRKHT